MKQYMVPANLALAFYTLGPGFLVVAQAGSPLSPGTPTRPGGPGIPPSPGKPGEPCSPLGPAMIVLGCLETFWKRS